MTSITFPDIETIRAARAALGARVETTPVVNWSGIEADQIMEDGGRLSLKMELFQKTGTFKARGALLNIMAMDDDELARGVTAVSAGNHAIATAYAAQMMGCSAKVVMLSTASQIRVDTCRYYGAEVVLVDDIHGAFEEAGRIEKEEGRTFVHPFEGKNTALGTATMGLEFAEQAPDLDAVIIPIGGGGLAAGAASAFKQAMPHVKVYGVEPVGADSMSRSLKEGRPVSVDKVRTIADSLGAPYAMDYTFSMCREYLDDIVLIEDAEMIEAMRALYTGMKIAVEPAGAAATAALAGPLRDKLAGQHVGLVICGTNISIADHQKLLAD